MNTNRGPFLYRLIWKAVDLVYPDITLEGLDHLPEEPCIVVGNHAQTHGPIITETRLPFDHYTWCAGEMMRREEVADYAFADFWAEKPGYIRWLFWLISRVIPWLAEYVFTNARTIATYHDSRCLSTFKKSVQKLEEGFHLVIYPESREPYNNIVYSFQDRFIDVARLYFRKTGQKLSFVPMYLAPKLKKAILGTPITFNPDLPLDEERKRICRALMDAITDIARAQPPHTVIPYPNMPKRDYPRSDME